MSLDFDYRFDIDEALQAGGLINPEARMYLYASDTTLATFKGETEMREQSDPNNPNKKNKNQMTLVDVYGYFFSAYQPEGNGKPRYCSLTVIMKTGIATPGIHGHIDDIPDDQLTLYVLHPKEDLDRVALPRMEEAWLQFSMEMPLIKAVTTFTSKYSPIPLDIVSFNFGKLDMSIVITAGLYPKRTGKRKHVRLEGYDPIVEAASKMKK